MIIGENQCLSTTSTRAGTDVNGNTRTKMAAKQGPAGNIVSGDVTRNPVARRGTILGIAGAWNEVVEGRRELDWRICFGDLEESPEVTVLGREVGARAADDLQRFFGAGWLGAAAPPRSEKGIKDLFRYWPSLGDAGAYARAIGLWARLQVLVEGRVSGIKEVRRTLRTDLTDTGFRHALAQARLAVQAHLAGAAAVIEPLKPDGNPGDVLVSRGGSEVFIELQTFNPNQDFVDRDVQVGEVMDFLRRLELDLDVHWSGEIPDAALTELREQLAAAARSAARSGTSVEVTGGASPLTVGPGSAPEGATLSGPELTSDHGRRILGALSRKARQTKPAGAAWVWLQDNGNALWPMSPFASYPLRQKVQSFASLVADAFVQHPHVVGVVLTSASMPGEWAAETEDLSYGSGFRTALPGRRVRESILVHRRLIVPGQVAIVRELCVAEPGWLDLALARLGVPGGLAGLTTRHSRVPTDSVSAQRSASGLYLA